MLDASEVRELLAHDILIEEKIDGANLGFSVDARGTLCAQNRGAHISLDGDQGQWKPLERWCASHAQGLQDALSPDLILFGEWCYAVHSIHYTRLPDWFLAFDVYDQSHGKFWSVERRDALAKKLGVSIVPMLGSGRFDLPGLRALLG
ncbi:MAG TPA: RNA ligase family protein, partial [Kofleriaceae bacterium]|nr:RNA ligase family protein [Kofleriaceae bacterium]